MKRTTLAATLSAVAAAVAATLAPAAFAAPHTELAQVISSTPIYVRVATPQRQCWTEQVAGVEERRIRQPRNEEFREQRDNSGSGAGTVLGAIIGGVVGHQFGQSTGGRDRGTAAGALIGGLIGNSAEREANDGYRRVSRDSVAVEQIPVTRDVQRCQTNTEYREQISGYDVRYRYNGREYSTRLDYDPGQTMPINVEVRPAGRGPTPSYSRTY